MRAFVAQLGALAGVHYRMWVRQTFPGRPPAEARWRQAMNGAMRAFGLIFMAGLGSVLAKRSGIGRAEVEGLLAWDLLGLLTMAFGLGFSAELPLPRQKANYLQAQFLEALPILLGARTIATILQQSILLPFWLTLFVGSTGGAACLALVVPLWLFGVLWGIATGKGVRTVVPAAWVARLAWAPFTLILVGIQIANAAPHLPAYSLPGIAALAGALAGASTARTALAATIVSAGAALAYAAVRAADRISYDRVGSLTSGRVAAQDHGRLDVARLERVLGRREPGRYVHIALWLLLLVFLGLLLSGTGKRLAPKDVDALGLAFAILAAQFAFMLGSMRAVRSVARDALARPLLAALPITPADTLAGKTRQLRRQLVPFALPLFALLALPRAPITPGLAWRAFSTAIALALYASAALSVAFLTAGLGSQRPQTARTVMPSLESFLVAIPFVSALVATSAAQSCLSLACLGAVAFEARRAARRKLAWLDDPEHATETPTWRALVVFAGFQAIQAIVGSLAGLVLDARNAVAVGYGASAAVLLLATLQSRPAPEPAAVKPPFVALGLAMGAVTGTVGFAYLRALERVGWAPSGGKMTLALGAIAVLVAPLAEELFFRGWLQRTILAELPAWAKRWAVPLTAAAFAAVHPAVSFAPVLLLGLAAGMLYARTKTVHAGIAAHAAHNAVAVAAAMWGGA